MKLYASERGLKTHCRPVSRRGEADHALRTWEWGLSWGWAGKKPGSFHVVCETARCLDLEKCCPQQVTGFMHESGRRPPAPGQPRAPEGPVE